jgi:hypothetical protein
MKSSTHVDIKSTTFRVLLYCYTSHYNTKINAIS